MIVLDLDLLGFSHCRNVPNEGVTSPDSGKLPHHFLAAVVPLAHEVVVHPRIQYPRHDAKEEDGLK